MKELSIIVACSTEYGIGYGNELPWNIPEELKNFKHITTHNVDPCKYNCVIMGKNTWLSLPRKPLPNRLNVIISSENILGIEGYDNVCCTKSVNQALKIADDNVNIEKIFIIGGAILYKTVLEDFMYMVDKIYMSIIYDKLYQCDKFIDSNKIYETFKFDKENIHFTEKYVFMIGYNKKKAPIDESVS
jgi:dihydrofolate reductase